MHSTATRDSKDESHKQTVEGKKSERKGYDTT